MAKAWLWLVVGAAAGMIAGVGYLAVTPPQYEATALVQIGQIGQQSMTFIESPARVVERIAFPAFKSEIVKSLGWDRDNDLRGALYRDSIRAKISTDLVELRVKGFTREDAAKALTTTVERLESLHRALAQPMIESLQAELREISVEVAETGKILAELERAASTQAQLTSSDRFSARILHVQLSATKEQRVRELRRLEKQHREWTSITGKAATKAFAEPAVSDVPVYPRKALTLVLAALGGMLAGIAAAVIRRIWQNRGSVRSGKPVDDYKMAH